MNTTKKTAPDVSDTQGAYKTMHDDFASQQDFTPEAAASTLEIAVLKLSLARAHLLRADLTASLIAANEALRATGAAIDSLVAFLGKGG
jgi:hypothetical protein